MIIFDTNVYELSVEEKFAVIKNWLAWGGPAIDTNY